MKIIARSILIFLLSLSSIGYAATLKMTKKIVMLGRTPVTILIYSSARPGDIYFRPHDDEKTALRAAKIMVRRYGGKVVSLSHGGDRLIRFYMGRQRYIIDPNRIFTRKGIRDTLIKYSHYSTAAYKTVRHFSHKIIRLMSTHIIIAVHNNKGKHYSSLSYRKGHWLAQDAKKIYLNPQKSITDFIYVTTNRLYKELRPYRFNLILQNRNTVTNDGSLSVYAMYHHIPYVNVEAGYGQLKQQLAMLKAVHRVYNN